jgi:hypothetical protein
MARFWLIFAAFAACVQWTIPHGWMAASDHEGEGQASFFLVPCPATAPELARFAARAPGSASADHGHHGAMAHSATDGRTTGDTQGADPLHGAAQAQCDFAAIGAPVLPPDAPDLAAPEPWAAALVPAFPEALPGRGLAAPPPPSTGPPSRSA